MAVTIKDVAALAGVSPSTVSRTCKNNPSISKETKEKVRQAMAELGYEPNFQASNLASQNSRTIGIILPISEKEAYENSFYLEAIRGISQFCNQRQYINTVITGQDEEEMLQAIRTMTRSGQVDGFIVLYSKKQDPILDYLYSEGLLYVLIGKAYQFANQTIYIDNDNLLAGQEATEYLYQLGHRKIAYLGSDRTFVFSSDRQSGYQTALLRHGIVPRPEYIVEISSLLKDAHERIRELLQCEERPTAILVSDDILAVSLHQVCWEMGFSIPRDLSILSFNNSLFARLTSPQLTSIDVNSFQLGIEAASQMINHIENPNLLATKIIVPHYLIERNSCQAIEADENN
ncbi:MAG: LacI family DNA-binding transcriptional regulator [Lachnospiraceae bacterium]